MGEPIAGKVGLDTDQWSQQPTDRPLVAGGGQVRRRGAISGQQRPQVGVEAIADPGHLGHNIFTGLDEQSNLEARVDRPDRRQVRFAGGHPGDGEGVTARPAPDTAPGDWRAGALARVVPHVMAPMVTTVGDVQLFLSVRREAPGRPDRHNHD